MTAPAAQYLDVLSALRESTGERHRILDRAMPLSQPDPDLTHYRDHLLLLRLWLTPLERWLQAFDDGPQLRDTLPPRWRLPLIEADLAHPSMPDGNLPAATASLATDRPVWNAPRAEPAYRWGVSYVIEGAQLGGAVLYRRLAQTLSPHPLRYLHADGEPPGPRWQQFVRALQAEVRGAEDIALACQGAQDAFDALLRLASAHAGTDFAAGTGRAPAANAPTSAPSSAHSSAHSSAPSQQPSSAPAAHEPIPTDPATVFDILPEAYLVVDQRGHVALANRRYLDMMGVSLPDILGKSVFDINQHVPAEQRAGRRAWVEATLRSIKRGERRQSPVLRYDIPMPHGDGSPVERYWQARATRIASSAQAVTAAGFEAGGAGCVPAQCSDLIVFTLTDVTESVAASERNQRERAKLRSQARLRQVLIDEANAELRSQQERLQEVLAFARVGAWEWNLGSGVIDCTAQCYRNLGIDPSSTLTQQWLLEQLIDPQDRSRVRSVIEEAIQEQRYFEVEYRVTWPDGSVRWLLARGAPRYAEDGTAQSLVGFTLDVTERKLIELRHQAIAEEEKLARARSEQATQAMDHFIAAVSHELRSPLHAILSWTVLMQRANDPSLVGRAADVIERNARQLALMVDDLLDSGAIVTGKLSVDLQPLDIGALAGIVAEDIRVDAESRNITLIAQTLSSCVVMGDESRLTQVIWNLLTNALKFSDGGTVEVSVRADETHAELAVRDTGRGIPADDLQRIFDRFQQASSALASRAPGLGLGLWLVRNLVELHGGTVSAESDGPGHGSTFRVRLPLFR